VSRMLVKLAVAFCHQNVSQACCSILSSESFKSDPRSLFPKQVIYDCIFTENNIKFMESK